MKMIFVVDDDPAFVRVCERVLKHGGYHVITAPDGAAALRTLAMTSVDLLLCDVFMPEKDGFETIQTVRRTAPGIPIIAMSGGGAVTPSDIVLLQCQKLGARKILNKPFTDAELLSAVREIIGPGK